MTRGAKKGDSSSKRQMSTSQNSTSLLPPSTILQSTTTDTTSSESNAEKLADGDAEEEEALDSTTQCGKRKRSRKESLADVEGTNEKEKKDINKDPDPAKESEKGAEKSQKLVVAKTTGKSSLFSIPRPVLEELEENKEEKKSAASAMDALAVEVMVDEAQLRGHPSPKQRSSSPFGFPLQQELVQITSSTSTSTSPSFEAVESTEPAGPPAPGKPGRKRIGRGNKVVVLPSTRDLQESVLEAATAAADETDNTIAGKDKEKVLIAPQVAEKTM